MSYCRWSSDDFGCDVYCYKSANGWRVHVAAVKYHESVPHVPRLGDASDQAWKRAYSRQAAWLKNHQPQPIGLSRDGVTETFDTPGDAADYLESLKAEGYRVPDYAIEALREEDAQR